MFWVIFGTASFTALVTLLILSISQGKVAEARRREAIKRGVCMECGAPLFIIKAEAKQRPMGFKTKK
jgi:hypothetical protein